MVPSAKRIIDPSGILAVQTSLRFLAPTARCSYLPDQMARIIGPFLTLMEMSSPVTSVLKLAEACHSP